MNAIGEIVKLPPPARFPGARTIGRRPHHRGRAAASVRLRATALIHVRVPLPDETGCETQRISHNLDGTGRLRDLVSMKAAQFVAVAPGLRRLQRALCRRSKPPPSTQSTPCDRSSSHCCGSTRTHMRIKM